MHGAFINAFVSVTGHIRDEFQIHMIRIVRFFTYSLLHPLICTDVFLNIALT